MCSDHAVSVYKGSVDFKELLVLFKCVGGRLQNYWMG